MDAMDGGGEQMRSCHFGTVMALQNKVAQLEHAQQNILATMNNLPGQHIATTQQVLQCQQQGVIASLKEIRVKQAELEAQQTMLAHQMQMMMEQSVSDHAKLVQIIIEHMSS